MVEGRRKQKSLVDMTDGTIVGLSTPVSEITRLGLTGTKAGNDTGVTARAEITDITWAGTSGTVAAVWTTGSLNTGNRSMQCGAYHDGTWLLAGSSGRIVAGTNIASLGEIDNGEDDLIYRAAAYFNGKFRIFGDNGRYDTSDDDAVSFDQETSFTSATIYGGAASSSRIVIVGDNGEIWTI